MEQTASKAAGVGSILDWINRYGFATVIAVILLAYVLVQQAQSQAQIQASIQILRESQAEQARVLSQISQSQAEISRSQIEISRTLDRLTAGR